MTTAAMTVRRRTGAEAMMVVVPTNLEGMAVNMMVVVINHGKSGVEYQPLRRAQGKW